jgi:putative serine protease PepD
MMPGGPADEAGMREGDWLLAIDDHYIYTVEELAAIVQSHKPGDKINVRYRRYATIYVTYVIMAGQSL